MGHRYITTENNIIQSWLDKVPRDATGCLPYDEWMETPEWAKVKKRHTDDSIKAQVRKVWNGMPKQPNLPLQPQARLMTTPTPMMGTFTPPPQPPKPPHKFCPQCGFEL